MAIKVSLKGMIALRTVQASEFSVPDYLNASARVANQILWWRRHNNANGIEQPKYYITSFEEVE